MLAQKLMGSAGGASDRLYSDSVFSTYLYTGNGSTQTINNGIDLAGKGGLVWVKPRSGTYAGDITFGKHSLVDTVRGPSNTLFSSTTGASAIYDPSITQFNSSGFGLSGGTRVNEPSHNYASWTFRKSPKFFDVVTYIGDGSASKVLTHSLGITPGMIIVKATSTTGAWAVWHRSGTQSNTYAAFLEQTAAYGDTGANVWGTGGPTVTDSSFTVGSNGTVNANGVSYVAYLFAHDTSADGIIQCGSFTTDGSGAATVNLGWEPQYLMLKAASATSQWRILDSMRDFSDGQARVLFANLTNAEGGNNGIYVTSTGLRVTGWDVSTTQIYLAIRRPNKPPTTGTEVYNAIARTGTGAAATVTGVGFAPDLVKVGGRNLPSGNVWFDRLRGAKTYLSSQNTYQEVTNSNSVLSYDMGGCTFGADTAGDVNLSGGYNYINHFFRRAPGFFDVVCYTGDGTSRKNQNHNLGVAPELRITKNRSSDSPGHWEVVVGAASTMLYLESNSAQVGSAGGATSTTFPVYKQSGVDSNTSGVTFVTYLFASLPGISKVGSYTGNGSSQTINCGFTTGARFILIKRTDSTGDWFVWDTARGIVSANDPHLSLNTNASEVTTDDSVDPANSGFIVNQVAATNINVTGGSYIFLAIS